MVLPPEYTGHTLASAAYKTGSEFYVHVTVRRNRFLYNKTK